MTDSDSDLFADDDDADVERAASAFGVLHLLDTPASAPLPDSQEAWQQFLAAAPAELALSRRSLGDSGLALLAAALAEGHGRAVVSMSLDNNGIGDAGIGALSRACATAAEALPALKQLFLSANSISGACLGDLAATTTPGGGLAQLSVLDLNRNAVGDGGLAALGTAVVGGGLAKLAKLYLDRAQIGDEGVCAFAASVRGAPGLLPSLYELWLSNNRIGAEGAAMLFAAFTDGAMSNLGDLRLQYNAIGDDGVDALTAALGRGALRNTWYLGLSDDARLSDRGLRTLEESIRRGDLPRLEFLTISGPHTGDAAKQSVQDVFTNRPRARG